MGNPLAAGLTSRTNTMGLRGRSLRWTITVVAVIGFSLFGYDQGLMSGIITAPQFNDEFPATRGEDRRATVIQGAVTSCYEIGCLFGALFALVRGERTGRRPLVLAGSLVMVVGATISTAAFRDRWGLGQFVVGRVVSGIGNGLNTATIPVWQSEMSKAENRGQLVNLEGSVIAVGTLIAYWLDFGFSYIDSSVSWRFPVAFQILFAVVLFAGMYQLPESPRWLLARGRKAEAMEVLTALEGDEGDAKQIQAEVRVIQEGIARMGGRQNLRELFRGGKQQHLQRMLVGASTQIYQQFTGCNAAIYYSTVLFNTSLGQSRRMSLVLGGVFATVYALATIPSFFLIERVGRRKLFLLGAAGQGASFVITFACLVNPTEANSKGAAVGLFLFIVFFAFTILQLPWIYPPEINPLRTRTAATGVSTVSNWASNFAVVMFVPVFISQARWGCYLFFACVNFSWLPVIYFYYPETAGRALEEIDVIYARSHVEGRLAWEVADGMPKLSTSEIESEAVRLGLYDEAGAADDGDDDDEAGGKAERRRGVGSARPREAEKPETAAAAAAASDDARSGGSQASTPSQSS